MGRICKCWPHFVLLILWVCFCAWLLAACTDVPPLPTASHAQPTPFLPGSVALLITKPDGESLCSGVLVSPTKIATARHCTRAAERIAVLEPDSGRIALGVHIIEDPIQDRAEVYMLEPFASYATLGKTLDRRPVRVQGFGCSHGERLEQRTALFYGAGDQARQIVWAGRACGGDSGGGIWTEDGRLAAIMVETGFLFDHGRRINIVVGELL